MRRSRPAVLAFAFLFFVPVPSRAAEPSEGKAAALFREGRALVLQGRFELACQRFAESIEVEPTIGALLNIADCRERKGELIAARAVCLEAYALARAHQDSERAVFAETRAQELDHRTPRLRVDWAATGDSKRRLTLDGRPVDEAKLGRPIAMDPGAHVVVAEAPGREPYRRQITMNAGDPLITVTLRVAPVGPGDVATPSTHRQTASLVAAGLGGALVAGGIVAGVLAFSRWDDVMVVCPARQCPTTSAEDLASRTKDDASKFALASTIGIVAGAVLLAGGLYVYLSDTRRTARPGSP